MYTVFFSSVFVLFVFLPTFGVLCFIIIEAVERYQQLNGKLPNPVIIYRDGVGDGDLRNVYDIEIDAVTVSHERNSFIFTRLE